MAILIDNWLSSWHSHRCICKDTSLKQNDRGYWHGRNFETQSGHADWQSWWRHQMETFSALLALYAGNSPVSGEFPSQRPVTRSFDGFFYLRLNKRLSKQSWGWWFETPSRSLWRRCNGYVVFDTSVTIIIETQRLPWPLTKTVVITHSRGRFVEHTVTTMMDRGVSS